MDDEEEEFFEYEVTVTVRKGQADYDAIKKAIETCLEERLYFLTNIHNVDVYRSGTR